MFPRENIWQVVSNIPHDEGLLDESQQSLSDNDELQQQQHVSSSPEEMSQTPVSHTLNVGADTTFASIPVLPSLTISILLQICLLAMVFVIPTIHEVLVASTNAFSVLQYCYVVTWALITVLSLYIYTELNHVWILGYHDFYHTTKHLHIAPFMLFTGGLAIMCILGTVVRDYCMAGAISPCSGRIELTPVNYQQIIVVIITLLSVGLNVKLMSDVYQFNQSALPADVLVDDLGVRLSQTTSYVNIGRPNSVRTVMEVQGAVISSLRNRVEALTKQVATLANSLEECIT